MATAILNVGSGAQKQRELAEKLPELCSSYGKVRVRLARTPQQLYAYAQEAVAQGDGLLLAGGGDGTISAVASVLAGSKCVLGVLPLGTFNYFAKRLSVPLEIEDALRVAFEGEVRTVPLGDVNGRVFLNTASIGLYPTMVKTREETYRRFGRRQAMAYLAGVVSLVRKRRHFMVEIRSEGERRVFRTPLLFAVNNSFQVEKFGIAGTECLRAGKLAFYILPPVGGLGLLRIGARTLMRSLDPGRDFSLLCRDSVRVNTYREFVRVAYDGEYQTMRSPLLFRAWPDALRVMTPKDSAADSSSAKDAEAIR